MPDRPPSSPRFSGTVLWCLFAFVGGVLLTRAGWLPGGSRGPEATFGEAWQLVEQKYVDSKAVQRGPMTQGAIRGMLESLGDTGHTGYLTASQFAEFSKALKGEFEGIGARLTIRKGEPTIVHTFPNSPARSAGLLSGDVLQEVDGKSVRGLSIEKVVELVRGPPGTTVHLRLLRPGRTDPLDLDVARAKVAFPDVSWHMLPGVPLAHVALLEFGGGAAEQLRQAIADARRQGAKGLVLDVRGNPGGLAEQAVAVTSEFLASGNVFQQQDRYGKRTPVPVRAGGLATDIPLCVLIDKGTASSAEIFAGALQDHGRGKLIGTQTFGTGTVLEPFQLSDGSVVMLAVVQWLTANGRQIWHQGIAPDFEVPLPETSALVLPEEETNWDAADLAKSKDRQLLKGVEVLKAQLP